MYRVLSNTPVCMYKCHFIFPNRISCNLFLHVNYKKAHFQTNVLLDETTLTVKKDFFLNFYIHEYFAIYYLRKTKKLNSLCLSRLQKNDVSRMSGMNPTS
jgi:hypothetical protein